MTAILETRRLGHLYDLIHELVVREIRIRYQRSVLGIGWSLLNPLLQLLVFFFASFTVAQAGKPIELLAAVVPFSSPYAMLARAAQSPVLWHLRPNTANVDPAKDADEPVARRDRPGEVAAEHGGEVAHFRGIW